MRLERRLTAAQLAAMAIAGSLLIYADVWRAMLPYHQHIGHVHGFGNFLWASKWEIARFVLPLVAGLWMMYGSSAAFRRGLEDEIWNDPSLTKLRAQTNRSVWMVVAYTMVLISLGYVVFSLIPSRGASRVGGFSYFFASPLICLTLLRQAMRPKRNSALRIWPGDVKPLVSEHWGDRAASQDTLQMKRDVPRTAFGN
jgi:hypothetical protein